MIECNTNQYQFTISEERTMKTSDIINPMEFRKGSSNSNSGSISKQSQPQLQQQQQQLQQQQNVQHTVGEETTPSNQQSQNLEFRRPRNKSFAKVLNRRQQIRDKFKNDFFSGKKSPIRSPTKIEIESQIEVQPFGDIKKVEEEKNVSQHSLDSDANVVSNNNLAEGDQKDIDFFKFKFEEVDVGIVQQVFLRIESKTDIDDIENDKKNNIFHITRGGEMDNFEKIYELQDVLGEGCVGLVKKAFKISDQQYYAVKIVRTRDEETIMNIKNEFLHLRELKHKNIVKVYELYIDKTKGKIYSVMELIKGREMFDVINQLGSYSEEVAKKIFKQIVKAIRYMHKKYVCHRDLKPNNILCDEIGENVKITDFNVSKFCDSYKDYNHTKLPFQRIKMWTYTGTIAFSAPELFSESCYDENIDIWSAGVILYTMLCGKEPFQAEFVKDLIQQIIEGKYSFPSDPWDKISFWAKDLIKKCLTINPEDRIKIDKMLKHPWLQDNEKQDLELDRNYLVENIDRLVKGRANSFEKQQNGRRRSNTLHIQTINSFKTSDILFSQKCFDNPSHHTEEESSDDQDEDNNKRTADNLSPMRAVSLTLQERPKDQQWFDIDQFQKTNQNNNKQKQLIKKLDDHLSQLSFLKSPIDKFNELNIFPNRTSSQNIMDQDQLQFINLNSPPHKLQINESGNN